MLKRDINNTCSFRESRGAVLPSSLWVAAICMIVLVTYTVNLRLGIKTVSYNVDSFRLKYAAQSGLFMTIDMLTRQSANQNMPDSNYSIDGFDVKVRIEHEASKLDLNRSDEVTLTNALMLQGVGREEAVSIAHKLLDYIDRDSMKRNYGLEDEDYFAAGRKYGALDSFITDLSEINNIEGIDKEVLSTIRRVFTIYPASSGSVYTLISEASRANQGIVRQLRAIVQVVPGGITNYRIIDWTFGRA